MMKPSVGERLAQLINESGVTHVFGVPGGQTLPLYEGILNISDKLTHILMRDERSAGFAADAYARLTGTMGVCDATVGPGATNLLSPLAEAFCSSIPVLAIISDIPRAWEHRRIRGNASQAMEQLAMFGPVSKWQTTLTTPDALETIFRQAVRVAVTGRPGPVVLSIPDDVGNLPAPRPSSEQEQANARFPRHRPAPDPKQSQQAARALLHSRRPVLLAGGGAHISGAGDELVALAERLQAPVVTSISGKGIIAEDHPLSFGVTGSMGSVPANDMVKQADLIFFIGCKAGQLATFGYDHPRPGIRLIHLDIDPEEIGRNFANSIALVADVRQGLSALILEMGKSVAAACWDIKAAQERKWKWRDHAVDISGQGPGPLKPQIIMEMVENHLKKDDLVVCDASLASGWAAVYLRTRKAGQRFMAPRGLAGLGWGAPAAIGAALAGKGRRIIHFAGDGGFAYSVQELEVMVRLNLPIITLVLNNDTLGWIKHLQQKRFDEQYISCDFGHIDFKTVARGFGARSYTAATLEDLSRALEAERRPQGPAVIDLISDPWETPVLKSSSGSATTPGNGIQD